MGCSASSIPPPPSKEGCPLGHPFVLFVAPHEFTCNICRGAIPADASAYACHECDFDVCFSCTRKAPADPRVQDALRDSSKCHGPALYRLCAFSLWPRAWEVFNAGQGLERKDLALKHVANHNGPPELALALLRCGADANATAGNHMNSTTLYQAILNRASPAMISVLLENGADPNKKRDDGYSPVHMATSNGDVEVLRLVLGAGGNANAQAINGATPLMFAVQKHLINVAPILLEAGADPNLKDEEGQTALHHAARCNAPVALVVAIMQRGGSPNVGRQGDGMTALDIAKAKHNPALVKAMSSVVA